MMNSNSNNNNNNNNNNSTMSNKVIAVDEEVVVLATDKILSKTQWPHMKVLCRDHKDVVRLILKAVDECKCTSELNANNSDNAKGNKWVKLYDVCFGGGSEGRGLLGGHLPQMPSPSKLKLKVMAIWEYLKKASSVGSELYELALRQEMEYEKCKAEDKATTDKQKANDAELQAKMRTYEGGLGALPPGAIGINGGGRIQHSTNLKTNEPAAYSWSNFMTRPDGKDVIDIDNKPKTKPKVKVSASATNGLALEQLMGIHTSLQKTVEKVMENNNGVGGKRKRMQVKLDAMEKQASHYQKFPNNPKMQAKLEEINDKYMALSDELNALDSDAE